MTRSRRAVLDLPTSLGEVPIACKGKKIRKLSWHCVRSSDNDYTSSFVKLRKLIKLLGGNHSRNVLRQTEVES